MALHGHFTVSGFPVGFQDDRIQIAKTCQTEDLFNLSAAESIPANTTEERRLFHSNCPQPSLLGLPSSPPPRRPPHTAQGGVFTQLGVRLGFGKTITAASTCFLWPPCSHQPAGVMGHQLPAALSRHLITPPPQPSHRPARSVRCYGNGEAAELIWTPGKLSPSAEAAGRKGPSAAGTYGVRCTADVSGELPSPLC